MMASKMKLVITFLVCVSILNHYGVSGVHTPVECPPTVSPAPTETGVPSPSPSNVPTQSMVPTITGEPTATHSQAPTVTPEPTGFPTDSPAPSPSPSDTPTGEPSTRPSSEPSGKPSFAPSNTPSAFPSSWPSDFPSLSPSFSPTANPSSIPTLVPTTSSVPSDRPSLTPTNAPSLLPSAKPSQAPTVSPSFVPSDWPSYTPSMAPSFLPSTQPSHVPSMSPSFNPSDQPSLSTAPTFSPTTQPSQAPTTSPSFVPSDWPSYTPSTAPSFLPSTQPSHAPTPSPSFVPSGLPSASMAPSPVPSTVPSSTPSLSKSPSLHPTVFIQPSFHPTSTWMPSSSPHPLVVNSPSTDFRVEGPDSLMPSLSDPTIERRVAEGLVTIRNLTQPMDSETVAVFEEVAVQFLIDHVGDVVDGEGIRFLYVQVTNQSIASIKTSRHLREKIRIDLDVAFAVGADVNEDVSTEFQWVVETIFEMNLADFFRRLERASAFFEPSSFQVSPPESQETGVSDTKGQENSEFLSTWVIACLAAVGLSIFVIARLVTRATRRNVQRELGQPISRSSAFSSDDEDDSSFRYGVSNIHSGESLGTKTQVHIATSGSSEVVEVQKIRSYRSSTRMGLSSNSEVEPLEGMKFAASGSMACENLPQDDVSTKSFMTRPYPSSMQAFASGKELVNDKEPHRLNARMRKRLIEREVERRGQEVGLSMKDILMASKSISEDEPVVRNETGQSERKLGGQNGTVRAVETRTGMDGCGDDQYNSHLLKNQKESRSEGQNQEPVNTRITSWLGRVKSHQSKHQDDVTNDGRSAITYDSAPFHSPYESRQRGQSSSRNTNSLPWNAEVISVTEDEQYRHISPTNWNEWDCPAAIETPIFTNTKLPPSYDEDVGITVREQSAGQPNKAWKSSIFFSPNLRKAAQGMVRRLRGKNETTETDGPADNDTGVDDVHDIGYDNVITILDERDDMENKKTPERSKDFEYYYANSSERKSGKKRSIHRLVASSPHWVSEGPDHAIGFMHIARDGDSISAASVELSLESFDAGQKQRRPLPPSRHEHHGNIHPTGNDIQRPSHHPGTIHDATKKSNTNTDNSSSTAWKRPARLAIDSPGSTPLNRKLTRQDPEASPNIPQQEPKEERDTQKPVVGALSRSIRSELNLPPSGVRLIKKTSSLARIHPPPRSVANRGRSNNTNKYYRRRMDHNETSDGRIGAAPIMVGDLGTTLVEMKVESNENALILGSIDEDYGGMELEWGHAI